MPAKTVALEALTPADPPAPSSILPPTPEEIDDWIDGYERLTAIARTADLEVKGAKEHLIFLVDSFGQVPPHAEQSRRLVGRHHEATVTRGTTVTVNEAAVDDFEAFLDSKGFGGLFARFFKPQTKHTLVEGARDVLKSIKLPRRIEETIASLFGRSIDVKSNAPSLKVKTFEIEKPTRTRKTGKAIV